MAISLGIGRRSKTHMTRKSGGGLGTCYSKKRHESERLGSSKPASRKDSRAYLSFLTSWSSAKIIVDLTQNLAYQQSCFANFETEGLFESYEKLSYLSTHVPR